MNKLEKVKSKQKWDWLEEILFSLLTGEIEKLRT